MEVDMTDELTDAGPAQPVEPLPPVDADPQEPLLSLTLECPCGAQKFAVGVPANEWRELPARRLAMAACSQLATMLAGHLTSLKERLDAYDRIPMKQRVGLMTKSEIIADYGSQTPCSHRHAPDPSAPHPCEEGAPDAGTP